MIQLFSMESVSYMRYLYIFLYIFSTAKTLSLLLVYFSIVFYYL